MIKGENQHVNVIVRGLIFEEGEFTIPELARHASSSHVGKAATGQEADWEPQVRLDRPRSEKMSARVPVHNGKVRCVEFPFVILK